MNLRTWTVRLSHPEMTSEALARALREGEPPVFARVSDDGVILDVRTLLPGESSKLAAAVNKRAMHA
ncbi:MAG: hypothetical protein U5N86_09255 [Planctomycetota bacterium]|nr:hypothetical protein [Planctomycetota bacterium]